MAWDFDEGGKFDSEKAAEDYARRNGLKDADFRTVDNWSADQSRNGNAG
ncbi:hypothetical protein [Sphingobium yanoikuyae]|jgi:hypothetical protein|nr:hypothetical protein [Sphingobium yanoikuyae]